MTKRSPKSLDRRSALKVLGASGAAFCGALSPLFNAWNPRAMAQGATPRRFMQVFLGGGWDSLLATDPVPIGSSKASGGNFQAAYHDSGNGSFVGAPVAVSGKPSLLVGTGLAAARPGFALIPTAFVNGMFVEVTAHELAVNYLLSGVLSLSRSREYASIIATMAAKSGGFPAHVLLGGTIPLAETAKTYPPLQAFDVDSLAKMLAGPYATTDYQSASLAAAHDLLATLNAGYQARLGVNSKTSLTGWSNSEGGLAGLYAERYDQRVTPSSSMLTSFNAGTEGDSFGARLALGANVLREGLSRFVTVMGDGYDTHQSHLGTHLPLMQSNAQSINALINFLVAESDPDSPSLKLAETTTVLITSEFNRTPLFNGAGGTDHWQTGSAIVMGRGVRDNVVIGSTSDTGEANDYQSAKLKPEHLAASLLRLLGFSAEGDAISGVNLSALFT